MLCRIMEDRTSSQFLQECIYTFGMTNTILGTNNMAENILTGNTYIYKGKSFNYPSLRTSKKK